MKKTAAALVAIGLVLAGCDDGKVKQAAATATTTTTTEPPVTPSGALGGYQPVSDVAGHARMSLDLCEITGLLDANPVNYAAVATIYRNGKNSDESEGVKRTLGKTASEPRAAEDTLGRYERYLGAGWLNAFVGDAIDGVGAFAGASDAVRRRAIQIGVRDQIMVAWALHELDAAVEKAGKGSYTKKSGAPHNWDEVWAYYHGDKPECGPHATADARSAEFKTGTPINQGLLQAMNDGLKSLVGKSATKAKEAREQVMRDITITYAQSITRSATQIDAALAQGKADEARLLQAEGWAYLRVIEPLIARANTTTAQTLAGVFDLASKPAPGSAAKVATALSGAYGPLQISASDIGEYHPA
jgi:hypothetical protein